MHDVIPGLGMESVLQRQGHLLEALGSVGIHNGH